MTSKLILYTQIIESWASMRTANHATNRVLPRRRRKLLRRPKTGMMTHLQNAKDLESLRQEDARPGGAVEDVAAAEERATYALVKAEVDVVVSFPFLLPNCNAC